MIKLNRDNIKAYAERYYTNTACLTKEEFEHDLNRINLISRLLNKYVKTRENFPIRLFLNHVITFYNVFDIKAATAMLSTTFGDDSAKMSVIKTCLLYLNYIDDKKELLDYYSDVYVAKLLKEEI